MGAKKRVKKNKFKVGDSVVSVVNQFCYTVVKVGRWRIDVKGSDDRLYKNIKISTFIPA